MKKILYGLFLMIFILLSSSLLSCQENNKKAVDIVDSYLEKQLSPNREGQYQGEEYIHPDLAIPGSDTAQFSVVDSNYSIQKVQKKIMNIDLIEPKDEEITIVSVLFKRYCDIYNNEYIPEKKDYERDYFLSESTGNLLILDYSEPWQETVSLEYAIQWAASMKDKSKKWSDLYSKLIALQKEEQAKQADK